MVAKATVSAVKCNSNALGVQYCTLFVRLITEGGERKQITTGVLYEGTCTCNRLVGTLFVFVQDNEAFLTVMSKFCLSYLCSLVLNEGFK